MTDPKINSKQLHLAICLYDCIQDNDIRNLEKLLTETSADPNFFIPAEDGTVFFLLLADVYCEEFTLEATQLFLKHGANPNLRSTNGKTPVHIAAMVGNSKLFRLLLQYGGDVHVVDDDGLTAGDYALCTGNVELALYIAEYISGDEVSTQNISVDFVTADEGSTFEHCQANETVEKTTLIANKVSDSVNSSKNCSSAAMNTVVEMNILATNQPNTSCYNAKKDTFIKTTSPGNQEIKINKSGEKRNTPDKGSTSGYVRKGIKTSKPEEVFYVFETNNVSSSIPYSEYNIVGNATRTLDKKEETNIPEKDEKISVPAKTNGTSIPPINSTYVKSAAMNPDAEMNTAANQPSTSGYNTKRDIFLISTSVANKEMKINKYGEERRNKSDKASTSGYVRKKIETNKVFNVFEADNVSTSVQFSENNVAVKSPTLNKEKETNITERERKMIHLTVPDEKNRTASPPVTKPVNKRNSIVAGIVHLKDDKYFNLTGVKDVKQLSFKEILQNVRTVVQNQPSDYTHPVRISITDEYKYTDIAQGIELIERVCGQVCHLKIEESGIAPLVNDDELDSNYDTDTLRENLTSLGYTPGPITKTTKRVYLRQLVKLLSDNNEPMHTEYESSKKVFTIHLEKSFKNCEWMQNLNSYIALEEEINEYFRNPKIKLRGGVARSSFNYLLLDSTITLNLPTRAKSLTLSEIWKTFINAIFYVGKGKRSRPYSHLYQAIKIWNGQSMGSATPNIQYIQDLWRKKYGVVCLHVFQSSLTEEAHIKEAAIIDVLGLHNLCNAKKGEYYGPALNWNKDKKCKLGLLMLYKSMQIFLNEGEKQLFPSDID